MHFAFIFSEYIELLLSERLWKFESTNSFWKWKWKIVLLLFYLFNYDLSKPIFPSVNLQRQPQEVFYEKHLCQSFGPANLLNKRLCFTLNFCKISKNTFFIEDFWATASEFVTEMLIFTSSHSQILFKISVLKTEVGFNWGKASATSRRQSTFYH